MGGGVSGVVSDHTDSTKSTNLLNTSAPRLVGRLQDMHSLKEQPCMLTVQVALVLSVNARTLVPLPFMISEGNYGRD